MHLAKLGCSQKATPWRLSEQRLLAVPASHKNRELYDREAGRRHRTGGRAENLGLYIFSLLTHIHVCNCYFDHFLQCILVTLRNHCIIKIFQVSSLSPLRKPFTKIVLLTAYWTDWFLDIAQSMVRNTACCSWWVVNFGGSSYITCGIQWALIEGQVSCWSPFPHRWHQVILWAYFIRCCNSEQRDLNAGGVYFLNVGNKQSWNAPLWLQRVFIS